MEKEGLPTTQISLIREHTEKIRPPRALWVPFELGRPLGIPDDPAFQTMILKKALKLFEKDSGPVLEDCPEDIKNAGAQWSCPAHLSVSKKNLEKPDQLCKALKEEMDMIRLWYDSHLQNKKRTTVGISKIKIDSLGDFICSFFTGIPEKTDSEDIPAPMLLKLAVDDLKAYYFESISELPNQSPPDSETFADWFWNKTIAADVVYAIRDICLSSDNTGLQNVGKMFLIPMTQVR